MFTYRCDLDALPVWGPLERVTALCCSSPQLPSLDLGDFMYMVRMVAHGRPDLHLYKHIDTRRYLSLDDAGHAYVFAGIAGGNAGGETESHYVPLAGLREAIDRLRLSSLPAERTTEPARPLRLAR